MALLCDIVPCPVGGVDPAELLALDAHRTTLVRGRVHVEAGGEGSSRDQARKDQDDGEDGGESATTAHTITRTSSPYELFHRVSTGTLRGLPGSHRLETEVPEKALWPRALMSSSWLLTPVNALDDNGVTRFRMTFEGKPEYRIGRCSPNPLGIGPIGHRNKGGA